MRPAARVVCGLALVCLLLPAGAVEGTPPEGEVAASIESAVRARRHLDPEARVRVRDLRPSDPAVYRRAAAIDRVELPPGESGAGVVTARIYLAGARSEVPMWLMARVEVERPTVVARTSLPRGAVLAPQDVERGWVSEARAGTPLGDPREVLGLRLKTRVSAGQPLERAMLEAPPVVGHGDEVQVQVSGRGYSLTTMGRVLDRGGVGELVRVRVQTSGKVAAAVVLGPRAVRIDAGGPRPAGPSPSAPPPR